MKRLLLIVLALLIFSVAAAAEEYTRAMPRVTKDPTDERVREDGYCEFVAKADDARDIIWHLISPDGTRDILAKRAPYEFPGLWVSGLNSELLGLDHVTLEMDGWHVRAEFVGYGGNLFSLDAVISIDPLVLETPVIDHGPKARGDTGQLEVQVSPVEDYAHIAYQWFVSSTGSTDDGAAIPGANEAAYTPEAIPGTQYYYCLVNSTDGTHVSPVVTTSYTSVTHPLPTQAAAETTSPVQESTALETIQVTEPVTTQTAPPVETVPMEHSEDVLFSAVIWAVPGLIVSILVIGGVLILRESRRTRKKKRKTKMD